MPEGTILAQLLNQFLTGAQLEIFFPDMKDTTQQHQIHTATKEEKAVEAELLKDPQLAAAMREGTMAAHKAAENSIFTKCVRRHKDRCLLYSQTNEIYVDAS